MLEIECAENKIGQNLRIKPIEPTEDELRKYDDLSEFELNRVRRCIIFVNWAKANGIKAFVDRTNPVYAILDIEGLEALSEETGIDCTNFHNLGLFIALRDLKHLCLHRTVKTEDLEAQQTPKEAPREPKAPQAKENPQDAAQAAQAPEVEDEDDAVPIIADDVEIEEGAPLEFIKIDTALIRSGQFAKLSPTAFKLWLILATRLRPNGVVFVERKDVKKLARSYGQDPKTTEKALDELLGYKVQVGKADYPLLKIEDINGVEYLRIPYESGVGAFDCKGKGFGYKYYVKWYVAPLDEALRELGGSQLFTLLAIGVHSDADGVANPSKETIGRIQGVSTVIIGKTLNKLEESGYIRREKEVSKRNHWQHNVYYFNIDKTGISFC